MTAIFGDTFFFIALLDERDEHHSAAVALLPHVERAGLVTTWWIFTELLDAHAAPRRRRVAGEFVDRSTRDPSLEVLEASQAIFVEALALYRRRPDKAWSFTDCTSFVVMRNRRLRAAATGDQHFVQAGFEAMMR